MEFRTRSQADLGNILISSFLAIVVSALLLPSPVVADEWSKVADTALTRRGAAMVYDSTKNVTLLHGGNESAVLVNDTWEWDGLSWKQVAVTGPPARAEAGIAHDSVRGVGVLFGGITQDLTILDDTWEWDGTSWSEIPVVGPSTRRWVPMAFDAGRGVTVLFGGSEVGGPYYGDTWEWDGVSWTQVATTGPPPRHAASLVYDSVRGVIVLFGGGDDNQQFNDTWTWDGTNWVDVSSPAPPTRTTFGIAFNDREGVALLYGGQPSGGPPYLDDMWQWDGTGWTEIALGNSPGERAQMGMVYDSERDVVVFHGGWTNTGPRIYWGDTWEYGPADIQGGVKGFSPDRVVCRNLTTGQEIVRENPPEGITRWNCTSAGLIVEPGDRLAIEAEGVSDD